MESRVSVRWQGCRAFLVLCWSLRPMSGLPELLKPHSKPLNFLHPEVSANSTHYGYWQGSEVRGVVVASSKVLGLGFGGVYKLRVLCSG